MSTGKRVVLDIVPGTEPSPDATDTETLRCIRVNNANFYKGKARSDLGNVAADPTGTPLTGAARTLYGYIGDNKIRRAIGTHTRLYVYQDGEFYNITPVKTATIAIADSLDTNYTTLGTDPFTMVSGSTTVTVAHTSHKLFEGDSITISGVSGTINGVPDTELNDTHTVRSIVDDDNYTILVSTAASSSASGGGASVVEATAIITVNDTDHGLSDYDRVKIASAATTGGIPDTEINAEHIIRNSSANAFDVVVSTKATSNVSSGGGASTVYSVPIDAGSADTSLGFGYGGGLYGVGLYGVGKTFVDTYTFARVWSVDRFGQDLVCCPGNAGAIYLWENDTDTSPVALSGAPTANWVFVSHNSVVALGAGGVGNRIKISAPGDATDWTLGAGLLPYQDDVEGAGTFISQAKTLDRDLLFTENEVFILNRPGLPDIWDIETLTQSDGLIGPRARISIDEVVFWVGQHDIYMFDGASMKKLLNNTVRDYVFNDMNFDQRWKFFMRADPRYNRVDFHYCSSASNEPDRVVKIDYTDGIFTVDTADRTAAEEPNPIESTPYMAYSDENSDPGVLYRHHLGVNDNGSAMGALIETNYAAIGEGDTTMEIQEFIPDFTLTGNIKATCYTKDSPQDGANARTFGPFTITPTTTRIDVMAEGRFRKWVFEQDDVDESFIMGKCYEVVIPGTPEGSP